MRCYVESGMPVDIEKVILAVLMELAEKKPKVYKSMVKKMAKRKKRWGFVSDRPRVFLELLGLVDLQIQDRWENDRIAQEVLSGMDPAHDFALREKVMAILRERTA